MIIVLARCGSWLWDCGRRCLRRKKEEKRKDGACADTTTFIHTYILPPKKVLCSLLLLLDLTLLGLLFHTKNCYFISIIHLTVTEKKKCRLWLDSLSLFSFERVHGWTNQRVAGRQPWRRSLRLWARNVRTGCHSIISSTRLFLRVLYYIFFSLPFLYTYPETARLYEKGGGGLLGVFILINWEEDDEAKRASSISLEEKLEKTVGHYISPPKLSKANLTHVP